MRSSFSTLSLPATQRRASKQRGSSEAGKWQSSSAMLDTAAVWAAVIEQQVHAGGVPTSNSRFKE